MELYIRVLFSHYGDNDSLSNKLKIITLSVTVQKTKPTQHSVRELRALGLTPHLLACRSSQVSSSPNRDLHQEEKIRRLTI